MDLNAYPILTVLIIAIASSTLALHDVHQSHQ